jgi:hypothetical protein
LHLNANEFRTLALNLPEALEEAHMGHPDIRVRRKIFATLGPQEEWGMVKLTPDQHAELLEAYPQVFRPVDGAWGRRGCTYVCLKAASKPVVNQAMVAAWQNVAPKRLVQQLNET